VPGGRRPAAESALGRDAEAAPPTVPAAAIRPPSAPLTAAPRRSPAPRPPPPKSRQSHQPLPRTLQPRRPFPGPSDRSQVVTPYAKWRPVCISRGPGRPCLITSVTPVGFVDVATTFQGAETIKCGHGVYKVGWSLQSRPHAALRWQRSRCLDRSSGPRGRRDVAFSTDKAVSHAAGPRSTASNGEVEALLLPAVMRYDAPVTAARLEGRRAGHGAVGDRRRHGRLRRSRGPGGRHDRELPPPPGDTPAWLEGTAMTCPLPGVRDGLT
jgi:hypothetical protein